MKKKVLLAISAMLVFGLAVVAYSYSTASPAHETATMSCCCSGDSCPMKKQNATGKEVAMSHENCECCKGHGESCPMMKKDASGNTVKMEGASCCPMMKDGKHAEIKDGASCPMKKDGSGAAAADMKSMHDMKGMDHDMKEMYGDMKGMHGEGCGCPCCQNKGKSKETVAVPAG